MKYKKIVLFFCIAFPISILLRTLQVIFTIDAETGFFKAEYNGVGGGLLIVLAAICAVIWVICLASHRNPDRPPKKNPGICISATLLAIALGVELLSESFSGTVMAWQIILLVIFGLAAITSLLLYAAGGFLKFDVPNICTIVPAVYFVMRIICTFASISSLALISDNIITLSAYCVVLVFFIAFGKLYNGVEGEKDFRKLMASGFVATILCFAQSVPYFILNFLCDSKFEHTTKAMNLSLLALGLFIGVFTFSHFSLSNMRMKHRHHSSSREEEIPKFSFEAE